MYRSPVSDHRVSWLCLGRVAVEGWVREGKERVGGKDVLWTLVDEAKLAEEADEAAVLELAHELVLKPVDTTRTIIKSEQALAICHKLPGPTFALRQAQ